ncbi:hypothetical protein EKH57_13530 [Halorubrum sp. BOL3-1]|uniref:SipW-dependent-type signal peptide-containing protein n=1 Tax=Halorubrum sp. BOL3-1 TaxID=2497325 RepID=UPI001004FD2A|nr:SipW-dependent-type signal peptide-containing protein [Halorubrum sp. BOL3-1]QAU13655.1 hypothetical protein EKH57_13530 [Halorubrum sp. BOL3-1]
MSDDNINLSRRKILGATAAVGVAGAGAGVGTSALFSDEESFEDNSITAGELDLYVEYQTSVTQDGVSTASVTADGTIQGGESGQYQIADVKPGDSGELQFDPKIVDNSGWVFVGSANGVTDYENGQTEPEEDVDGSGGGSLGSSETGQGAGELSEAIQVTVKYNDPNGGERELNNPSDYTLADLFKELESGFLLDGEPFSGDPSGPQPYPGSPTQSAQNGPGVVIEWELPVSVGNEIQSDAVGFDVTFAALQSRNNGDPENPFVDLTVGTGSGFDYGTIEEAVDNAAEGDVISVAGKSFKESVTVDTAGLTIAGAGEGQTTIDATNFERGIAIEADGVTVCDLTVDAAGSGVSSGEVEGIFVGDANGFTDENGIITIRDVTVSNVDAGDLTAEGIHIKSYGNQIDGVSIKNVTIDGVNMPGAGANGVKVQADVRNVKIDDTEVKNISGKWSYGVVLTPSSNQQGTPSNVSITGSTIDTVTANTYDGVGVGIDGSSGNGFADPRELSIIGNSIKNLDIGILNKNPNYTSLNIDSNNTYQSVGTIKQGL